MTRFADLLLAAAETLAVSLLSAPQGFAQPARAASPRFEVASIRPAAPARGVPAQAGGGNSPAPPPPPGGAGCIKKSTMDAGRVDLACVSLKELLMMDVFGVPQNRLSGPDWMDARQFDISAKLPAGASQDQLPQMFQALLVDRLGLAFHREHKEQPVNALVLAKGGLKVKPAAPESSQPAWVAAAANSRTSSRGFIGGIRFRSISLPGPDGAPATILQTPSMGFVRRTNVGGVMHYEAPGITFEGLAELAVLAGNGLDPMVVDMTGAKGRYQVTLDISLTDLIAEIRAHPGDPSAVQDGQLRMVQDGLKKLGLQLEPRKAPVEIIVIDRLQKTPAQN